MHGVDTLYAPDRLTLGVPFRAYAGQHEAEWLMELALSIALVAALIWVLVYLGRQEARHARLKPSVALGPLFPGGMRQFLEESARSLFYFVLTVTGMIAGMFALAVTAYYGSQLYAELSHFDEEQMRWGILFFGLSVGLWVIIAYLRTISQRLAILIEQSRATRR
jgi:hypothetical protein